MKNMTTEAGTLVVARVMPESSHKCRGCRLESKVEFIPRDVAIASGTQQVDQETWKAIPLPGWENREASNLGRFRTWVWKGKRLSSPRIIPQHRDSGGYLIVSSPRIEGRQEPPKKSHRLVLLAFVGEPPSAAHIAAHGNGIRDDNRPANLRWATPAANTEDMRAHGTMPLGDKHGSRLRPDSRPRGEENGRAKLTEKEVLDIRRMRAEGQSLVAIAKAFGLCKGSVHRIVTGRNWKHLTSN